MAGYRDLSVWHRGIDLCIEIYELTKNYLVKKLML